MASLRDALFSAFDLSKLKRHCNSMGCVAAPAFELTLSEKDTWNYSIRGVGSVFFCEACATSVSERVERIKREFSHGRIIEIKVFRL